MHCGKCGMKNQDDAKFCGGCGSPLAGEAVVTKDFVVESIVFMKSALHRISEWNFFRRAFTVALQVMAAAVIFFGLVSWISLWRYVWKAPLMTILGIVISQGLFIIAICLVASILFIRSRDIAELPEADFTVIPIASIFLKLIGEVYASFVAVISVAGGIVIWFIGGNALHLLKESVPLVPIFGGGEGFFGGLRFIAGGLFMAFLVLVFSYFLAESVVVMADMAKNIKITRQLAEQQGRSKKSA